MLARGVTVHGYQEGQIRKHATEEFRWLLSVPLPFQSPKRKRVPFCDSWTIR